MTETIDQLRALLALHDRSIVSLQMLAGQLETTELGDSHRSWADNDDRAIVIAGPKDKLDIVRTEDKTTGRITYLHAPGANMTPLPPIGEARLNKALRHHALAVAQAQSVARACREAQDTTTYKTTAAGDERKLRGIPAIGRGVSGCIPGTSPHANRP